MGQGNTYVGREIGAIVPDKYQTALWIMFFLFICYSSSSIYKLLELICTMTVTINLVKNEEKNI